MASFPKVSPRIDGNAVVTGLKPLEFFEVDVNANIAGSTGPMGGLQELIKVIEQRSTIEVLGKAGTINLVGANGNLSSAGGGIRVALADLGTWGYPSTVGAQNLQANIRAVGNFVVGNGAASFPYANVNFSNANVYAFTF